MRAGIKGMSMADVILKYPEAAGILKKHNLDYCYSRGSSLADACGKEGIDPFLVIHEILGTRLNMAFDKKIDFNTWDIPLVIDFIVQHHHRYLRSTIPDIRDLLDKLCDQHGDDHPVLFSITAKFYVLERELLTHMEEEERVLFPLVAQLNNIPKINSAGLLKICNSILEMEHDHDKAGEMIKFIREATNCYTPPPDACTSYKMTFLKLSFLDDDLVQHLHLENNILFPKAKALAVAHLKRTT